MSDPVELRVLRVNGAEVGPRLLVLGGVHGDEFEPMVAVRSLASRVSPGELRGVLELVPVVNQPALTRASRTGPDDLDLARVCPGTPDGSPTERIAWQLSRLIRAADYLVDLHTGGSHFEVLPLVGYMCHADPDVHTVQRRMARAFGLPLVWGTDGGLDGRSLSVARDAGVPAIYAEYGGGGRCDPDGVAAYVRGCLGVMRELGVLAGGGHPTAEATVAHAIEDRTPGSGHLQVQYPAPAAGLFTPTVDLGARVAAGETLGTVVDPVDGGSTTVRARERGLVMMLRRFAAVVAGDPLVALIRLVGPDAEEG